MEDRKRKAPVSRQCVLCCKYFNHDGYWVWTELRLRLFDKDGRHVVGVEEQPMEGDRGFYSDGAVGIAVRSSENNFVRVHFLEPFPAD